VVLANRVEPVVTAKATSDWVSVERAAEIPIAEARLMSQSRMGGGLVVMAVARQVVALVVDVVDIMEVEEVLAVEPEFIQ